jgi:uncharacterized protein HemX
MADTTPLKHALNAGEKLAVTAPHWVCLILVVAGFLVYLDRKDANAYRQQQVQTTLTQLTIDQGRNLQERNLLAISRIDDSIQEHSKMMAEQRKSFESLVLLIDSHLRKVNEVPRARPN